MKKVFFGLVILTSLLFLWFRANGNQLIGLRDKEAQRREKQEILRFAIVSDSENDNEELEKGLAIAKAQNVKFVVGLGDFTQLGNLEDLKDSKSVFDRSGLTYYVTAGDRDLWESRNSELEPLANFGSVFGSATHNIIDEGIHIVILDNSDIYKGLSSESLDLMSKVKSQKSKVTFVMAHKTPYHPQTAHIMGADNADVANQAQDLINRMEESKIDGFFSGDIHFFAKYNSPNNVFKMNTIGAITREKNFQGPSVAIVRVYNDYSWESESVEIN